ncbi:hypothetical protein KC19_4G220600 [Ceratodon purpureus]|uniref:Uncharacterized protein n=2 Tax=Ceratodon purpureus TaxID=3225 RepID=A0A8T0IDV8_CERPU|nr:hypothetical protein KC19_4G220600 [Ceratodon purpureus]
MYAHHDTHEKTIDPNIRIAYFLDLSAGHRTTVTMGLCSKVGLIFCFTATVLTTLCPVEGVHVSIGSMMTPIMTVHCVKGNQDEGVRVVRSMHEYSFDVSGDFRGPYVCNFEAAGKRTTMLDVCNSRCNCDTYSGCAWVVRNDGFYCNHDLIQKWA